VSMRLTSSQTRSAERMAHSAQRPEPTSNSEIRRR
jgi:hypothetical protein